MDVADRINELAFVHDLSADAVRKAHAHNGHLMSHGCPTTAAGIEEIEAMLGLRHAPPSSPEAMAQDHGWGPPAERQPDPFSAPPTPAVPVEMVLEGAATMAPDPEPEPDPEVPPDAEPVRDTATLSLFGEDLFGSEIEQAVTGNLAKRFLISPFSVLNAREGWWQERKRAWISLGIKSEVGRDEELTFSTSIVGNPENYGNFNTLGTTSIFDPVLCEMFYRWWCPAGGLVLDPFAGGSVRGIVAARLGRHYHGIELSERQVTANREQGEKIIGPSMGTATWHHGDSAELLPDAPHADFILSCPPYGDLERYSEDARDLSTMPYEDFLKAYFGIIAKSVDRLRGDRFAAWVVGDFRDKRTGHYRNFPAATIEGFRRAGAALYNEAILVTAVGTLGVRTSAQFGPGRKLGKTHQNLYVFIKGDAKRAAGACETL